MRYKTYQDSEIWLARDCTSFEDLVSEVELGLSKIMFHMSKKVGS